MLWVRIQEPAGCVKSGCSDLIKAHTSMMIDVGQITKHAREKDVFFGNTKKDGTVKQPQKE